MEDSQKEIEKRKKKVLEFLKNPKVWTVGFLALAIILGIYIRSMPMHDHGGTPGLWDVTTDTWTLGPDLDPWLFLRIAKTIEENGSIPEIDNMRNFPLGFDNRKETMLLPYLIYYTYRLVKPIYPTANMEYAGAIFPVIMFVLTILSFFLFTREIFVKKTRKSKIKANSIALISTLFMIVIPVFLSRTIAGIPEKESAAFFFMFLSFYLFLKGWKCEDFKESLIFGLTAGLSTSLMSLIWGGHIFVYLTVGISTFVMFLFKELNKKEISVYNAWIISSILFTLIVSDKYSIIDLFTSIASGSAIFVLFLILVDLMIWNTKISKYFKGIKIPKKIISLGVTLIFVILITSVLFGPSFVIEKIKAVQQMMFKPVEGRWNTTVAENRQPYFTEWAGNFGPFMFNIPLMLWMFILGATSMFKKATKKIGNKDSWILTGGFFLLILGIIFSRYSSSSILNGENFLSKIVYYGVVFLFLFLLGRIYFKDNKRENFRNISYPLIFLLSLLLISIFSARGAVRLIMVLGPVASIFLGYLIVESLYSFIKNKEENKKLAYGTLLVIVILISVIIFWNFFGEIKSQSYSMVPSYYNQQWQYAMSWVRENTPEDSVFGHWWDYGYWIQSIGGRATVLDGGNAITFWNYYMGRNVLTGDNPKDALEFLYAHDTDYFLIDSTDIGKYGAFSSIGSDENYDRYSWIHTMLRDKAQTQETQENIIYVYSGGTVLDEDITFEYNGEIVFLPKERAFVGGVLMPIHNLNGEVKQPEIIFVYNNKQYKIPMRYIAIEDKFLDFGSGIEAVGYLYPRITQTSSGMNKDDFGAMMYLSPRVTRGMLAQKYILNDPFNRWSNFELVHEEDSLIVKLLKSQEIEVGSFVYYGGLQGPIKIWKINYEGDEELQEKYLDKDASKYLSWRL